MTRTVWIANKRKLLRENLKRDLVDYVPPSMFHLSREKLTIIDFWDIFRLYECEKKAKKRKNKEDTLPVLS